jgi:hypothetical protein
MISVVNLQPENVLARIDAIEGNVRVPLRPLHP